MTAFKSLAPHDFAFRSPPAKRGFIAQRRWNDVGPHGAKTHLVTLSRATTESALPDTLSLMFAVIL